MLGRSLSGRGGVSWRPELLHVTAVTTSEVREQGKLKSHFGSLGSGTGIGERGVKDETSR